MRLAKLIAAFAIAALIGTPAFAHSRLVTATPAPNSVGSAPSILHLQFTERLVGQFSSVSVAMTGMPGMTMNAPVKIPATTSLSADGKRLVVKLARPLAAGTYRVDWHVASIDTHRTQGGYAFQVK
jgi:methionine-rich copper-binding protein CopC